jgi:hypothetical protein
MAWARRMNLDPNPDENEEPGRDWAEFRHPDEKNVVRGLVGETSGDALTTPIFCDGGGVRRAGTHAKRLNKRTCPGLIGITVNCSR